MGDIASKLDKEYETKSAQEIAELQRFQAEGIDPATRRPFTSVDRLVRVFLERNVPGPAELMVGVVDNRLRVASSSTREALLDDPRKLAPAIDAPFRNLQSIRATFARPDLPVPATRPAAAKVPEGQEKFAPDPVTQDTGAAYGVNGRSIWHPAL